MRTSIIIILTIACCIWTHATIRCVTHFMSLMEDHIATITLVGR